MNVIHMALKFHPNSVFKMVPTKYPISRFTIGPTRPVIIA